MATARLEIIEDLATELSGEYQQGMADARLTQRALKAGQDSGIFEMANPPDPWTLPEIMTALRRLSMVEPGLAWSAMNSFVFGHAVARMSDGDRNDLLANASRGPYSFSGIPGGRAQRVDTGFVLKGSWPFLTAVEDSKRAVLAGLVEPSERPDVRFFIVDPSDISPGQNWNGVAALRTSGSHSAEVDGLNIDEHLAVRLVNPPVLDDPLYRLPLFPYFFGGAIANYLGILRAGIEDGIETISGKRSSVDGAPASSNPATQIAVGNAEAALRACEAAFDAVVDQMWQQVLASGGVDVELRGACYRTYIYVIDTGRETMSRLHAASSTVAWNRSTLVHQALLDTQAIAITFERIRKLHLDGGKQLLGLDPNDPLF